MNLAEKITLEDTRHADALRFLAADAVEQAQSGHPGAPMGMADIARCCGVAIYPITPLTLAGSIATALCCPMAMGPCCCTLYCT